MHNGRNYGLIGWLGRLKSWKTPLKQFIEKYHKTSIYRIINILPKTIAKIFETISIIVSIWYKSIVCTNRITNPDPSPAVNSTQWTISELWTNHRINEKIAKQLYAKQEITRHLNRFMHQTYRKMSNHKSRIILLDYFVVKCTGKVGVQASI